jgi:hypothetical protein
LKVTKLCNNEFFLIFCFTDDNEPGCSNQSLSDEAFLEFYRRANLPETDSSGEDEEDLRIEHLPTSPKRSESPKPDAIRP